MSKFITLFILLFLVAVVSKIDGQVTVPIRNPLTQTAYTMDFESAGDFSLSFPPWITTDVDHSPTYQISGEAFPHAGQPFAFISFIPILASPPMTQADIQPHSGSHFGACFSDTLPPNNDWFISPRIHLDTNGSFSFWMKSYTGRYGLEKYKVGVSVTDSAPGSFTFISGSAPLLADTFWTKRTFSLSAFNNRQVYVAIQCVSDNAFIFMIDDLVILPGDSVVLAGFSADKTSIPAGASVSFTDQSDGSPDSWSWSFPGGSPAQSNLKNPTVMYATPGTYDVTLTVNKGTHSDTKTVNNYITVTSGFPSSVSLDFESQADFSLDFNPWFVADVNGGETYGIQNYTFTNQGDPYAFITFNPSKVVPAMTDSAIQPHSGQKYGACFSSLPPHNPNNKWLISPKIHLGNNPQIGLWVKTCNTGFDFEKYNIAVSTTTNNPSDFSIISGPLAQQAPAEWAYRQYSLSDFTGKDVFVGIQCVSNDQFIFMVDDIRIGSSLIVNEMPRAEEIAIFPNPARDKIFINFGARTVKNITIVLFNSLGIGVGQRVFFDEVNGPIEYRLPSMTNGVYFLSVTDEKGNRIKKIIIEK